MRFEPADEHHEFDAALAGVLARHAGPPLIRRLWDGGGSVDALRSALAGLGVTGLTIDESDGGAGLASSDCVLVLERLGRHLVPIPVAECVGVVAPVLIRFADRAVAAPILQALAAGNCLASIQQGWEGWGAWVGSADIVLVVDRDELCIVKPGPEDVEELDGVDPGRRIGRVIGRKGILATYGAEAAEATRRRAAATAGCLLTGASIAAIDAAVGYAKARHQFGRPIGSFQAVKHLLAEAYAEVEASRRTPWWALVCLDTNDPETPDAVAIAKATTGEAAKDASYAALQVYGGIGYTWECDLQLYLKRIQVLQASWGTADEHWTSLGSRAARAAAR